MKRSQIIGIFIAFLLVVGIGIGVHQLSTQHPNNAVQTSTSSGGAGSPSSSVISNSSSSSAKRFDKKKQPISKSSSNTASAKEKNSKSTRHRTRTNSNLAPKNRQKYSASKLKNISSASTHQAAVKQPIKKSATHSTKKVAKRAFQTKKRAASTSTKKHSQREQSNYGTAYIKVSGYKKTLFAGRIAITKKTTAFSILQATKLKLEYTRSPDVYVSGINDLRQNDIKVGSGWMYSVNNKYVDKAANDKRIRINDKVHWYFSVNGLTDK